MHLTLLGTNDRRVVSVYGTSNRFKEQRIAAVNERYSALKYTRNKITLKYRTYVCTGGGFSESGLNEKKF